MQNNQPFDQPFDLQSDPQSRKRRVLISGACGGIGKVLCQRFVANGDFVYAQDLPSAHAALASLVTELGAQNCAAVAADICDAHALQIALAAVTTFSGEVDVLIANAGAAFSLNLRGTTENSWKQDLDLNLNGTFNTVEAVRSTMQLKGRGNIILIGSVNGMSAFGHPAYSVAKAGLISYTKALAMEFGPYGIRSNMICPGTVKTQAWQARVDKNPQVFEDLKKWYPLRDFATPDDIANAALFLASDAARVITGVILPVDGGLMAGNPVFAAELTQESM